MEPMTLGSPSNSPAGGNPYLPTFLMGENPASPRSNSTYSPTKRSLSYAQSPGNISSSSVENSYVNLGQQKSIFAVHNASISGPPTQGLFDSLRTEQNQIQTPSKNYAPNQSLQMGNLNHSILANESYLNSTSFNSSRIASPNICATSNDFRSPPMMCPMPPKYSDFWITVYGFPQSATSMVLAHFTQCGTIVDKIFPPQNGNWVHLKFSSCLESDRALNYNEKILGNNIMIGVTRCKDSIVIDKENVCEVNSYLRARPLSQVAFTSAQNDSAIVTSPNAPQRSTGFVNKAMDLLFGW